MEKNLVNDRENGIRESAHRRCGAGKAGKASTLREVGTGEGRLGLDGIFSTTLRRSSSNVSNLSSREESETQGAHDGERRKECFLAMVRNLASRPASRVTEGEADVEAASLEAGAREFLVFFV